ncbi:hypothetical protein AB1Y20_015743 [Prymnesium parvum]|uniref:Coiled-coil domain-containing protein 93 n=1 Tax=Prymnesium parvum TaxID=97485 RepID=A0AB34JZD0_PRYPA
MAMMGEALARYEEICQLLVAAGYFRARIPMLSPFDKVAGGIAWCMTAASVDIDVDFQENATIGQKIKIGEGIERTLKGMKAPPLQAHQLQGLDFDAIYPVVQWLVKAVYGIRDEIGDAMRRLSLSQFDRYCAENVADDSRLTAQGTHTRYAPARRYRLKGSVRSMAPPVHATHVLLEYGMQALNLSDGGTPQPGSTAKAIDASHSSLGREAAASAGEEGELPWSDAAASEDAELSQSQIIALVSLGAADIHEAALRFAQQSESLMSSGEMAGVYKARSEREAIERRLQYEMGQLDLERSHAEKVRKANAAMEAEIANLNAAELKQRELQQQLVADADENAGGEHAARLVELEKLVKLSADLTDEAKKTLGAHQSEKERKEQQLQQMASPGEEFENVEEIERLYESELDKSRRMKRLVGQKGRSIALLQRKLDDVPNRAELVQYERRFRELYHQVASKLEETKKYFNLYNTLEERKGFLLKEISLINSIHENFCKMAIGGGREKLVSSIEGIITSVKQNLIKVNTRLEEEVHHRDGLQASYDRLVEKERRYYKLVREFQAEAMKNEQLVGSQG